MPLPQPDFDDITSNHRKAIAGLISELFGDLREMQRQIVPDETPRDFGLACHVKKFETVPRVFQTIFQLGQILTENAVFDTRLGDAPAHHPKIFAFELFCAASTSDADDLIDPNIQKMLQKLVQCMVCVTAMVVRYGLAAAGFRSVYNLHDEYWAKICFGFVIKQNPHQLHADIGLSRSRRTLNEGVFPCQGCDQTL